MAKRRASGNSTNNTTADGFVPHSDDPMLSYTEAGDMVGRSNTTIRRWVEEGFIRKVEDPSGLPRVRKSELTRFYTATALPEMDAERAAREERNRQDILAKMQAADDRQKAIDERERSQFNSIIPTGRSEPEGDGAVEATLVEEPNGQT